MTCACFCLSDDCATMSVRSFQRIIEWVCDELYPFLCYDGAVDGLARRLRQHR